MSSGSGLSNVGNSQVYESGDQRNYSQAEIEKLKSEGRWQESKQGNHRPNATRGEDEATIRDRLERQPEGGGLDEADLSRRDPTLPAKLHGNEPSKGAKIDAEIQADDLEEMRRKGRV